MDMPQSCLFTGQSLDSELVSFCSTINNNVMNSHVQDFVHACSVVPDTLRPHGL